MRQTRSIRVCQLSPRGRVRRWKAASASAPPSGPVPGGARNLPAGDVEHHFDALIENNLIREDTPARFSFHSLIRDCTRELLVEEAGAAA
ncbi:hypothetical protein ACFU6S_29270 [Streptomyces sp. NPDC057456]|uniref:hypothetical protein n=1 Tax=Streptomyces sp. NPDC057456 TaxID=3346139 RepID=UPI0036B48EF9